MELVFGCESDETGEIFRQRPDGLLGMGHTSNSFHGQVVGGYFEIVSHNLSQHAGYHSQSHQNVWAHIEYLALIWGLVVCAQDRAYQVVSVKPNHQLAVLNSEPNPDPKGI